MLDADAVMQARLHLSKAVHASCSRAAGIDPESAAAAADESIHEHADISSVLKKNFRYGYRQFRLRVYCFLERPTSTLGMLYHVGVFSYIMFVYMLSAVTELNQKEVMSVVHYMEVVLAVYFTAEFLVRMWAVAADGKYQGFMGRVEYLKRPVCFMDVIILGATLFVVLNKKGIVDDTAIEKLRFLQILRLFHIDRQMTTWKLIREMIKRSKYELIAVYYITFMLFITLAVCVYTTETDMDNFGHFMELNVNSTDGEEPKKPTFKNFGEAFWFSIVSVLTIGYGDFVPKEWQSKLIVSFFSYIGLSMFSAASGLVGVGMSLMLNNQTKQRKQGKVRNLAARTIQTWYRFHLISNEQKFSTIPIYRRFCAKLQQVEERMNKARIVIKKTSEKKFRPTRLSMKLRKQFSAQDQNADSLSNEISYNLMRSGAVIIPQKIPEEVTTETDEMQEKPIQQSALLARRGSGPNLLRKMLSSPDMLPNSPRREFPEILPSLKKFGRDFDGLNSESNSTHGSHLSLNFSDEEKIMDAYYYSAYRSHSSSFRSEENSSVFDESLTGHYRSILRMLYFFLFITLRKKFKRARKPYELMDAEAELCEMEHQRTQKFKEVKWFYIIHVF